MHAAILSVLVQAQGIARTAAEIEGLDRDMDKAAATGGDMAASMDKADQAARKMGSGADTSGKKVSALAGEIAKAKTSGGLWQDSMGRWRNEAGRFASAAEKAAGSVSGLDASMGKADQTARKMGTSAGTTAEAVGGLAGDMASATKATDLWTDSQGRWRNSTGQFASTAEKAAAGVGGLGDSFDKFGKSKRSADALVKSNIGLFGQFSNAIKMTRQAVSALGGGFGPMVTVLVMLAPIMLALIGAAFALGAALAPLAGLAGAAAVGLGALAQAGGVVALASMGVGDALKEQIDATGKAAKAAQSGADQQKTAARAIAAAQEGVRAAHDRVRTATENLSQAEAAQGKALDQLAPARVQARRDLEDMRSSLEDASLSEKVATRGLADARKALAQAMNPVDVGRLTDAQATLTTSTLSEQRAVIGLTDARQRLEDLMKPADALTVADAQDAVADATRGETQAALNLVKAREKVAAINAPPANDIDKAQAALNLTKAQQKLNAVNADAKSTDVTRTQAALDLAKAQARVDAISAGPATEADRAQAALDLADAENAVGDASRASAHAAQQLEKLQSPASAQDLAKANLDVADAQQAISDATRNTAKAQQDVTDAQKGADPDAVAAATLAVAQAQKTLTDATRDRGRLERDLAAAEKAGVDGSAGVIAARERIADANRQVTNAERDLKDASRDVTKAQQAVKDAQLDAAKAAGAAAAANVDLNAKFNALPPAAQAFVLVLKGLKPKLDELRATAAAGLFPGVISGLNAAMGAFNPVKKVVGETAAVIGDLADRAGELVGSKGFGRDIETIGGRNAKIIERLGGAAIYLGDMLRHIIVAAGPLTTWLALVAEGWAKSADEATEAARKSGKLADFFQKTKDTLKTVASIVGNLATAFYNAGKQAAPFGRDMLKSIDSVTGRFAAWTKSVEGQKALQDFFKESSALAAELMPALNGILGSLGSLAFSVLPAYVAILGALGPLAGPLVQAFVLWKLALTGVTIATTLFAGALWLYTAATAPATAGQVALNAALLANPIAWVVIGLVALGAALVVAYQQSETFRDIVNAVWASIQAVAAPVIDWLSTAIPAAWDWIKTATVNVWDFLQPYLAAAWEAIKTVITTYFDAYKTVISTAWTAVKTATTKLWDWFGPYLTAIFEILKALVGGAFILIEAAVTGAWDGIKAATELVWPKISAVAKAAWDALKLVADTSWAAIKAAIVDPINAVVDLLGGKEGIWEKIKSGAQIAWDGLKGIFDLGKDAIVASITAPFKAAVKLVGGFAKKILQVVDLIPGVDMGKPIGQIDATMADFDKATGGAKGLARGGAFARTGGIVDQPMTFMGEEAPRHPEFVIPTNPAYRGRAQMLAMQAAKAVGLAKGGVYTASKYGGHDDPSAFGHKTASGAIANDTLWGFAELSNPPGSLNFSALGNLAMGTEIDIGYGGKVAKDVPKVDVGAGGPGLDGHVRAVDMTYAVAQALGFPGLGNVTVNGEDGGKSIFSKIGDAVGSAVSSVADTVAGFVNKLPSAGGLGMMEGLGLKVLSDVKDWIKDKVGGLFGGGGSGGPDLTGGMKGGKLQLPATFQSTHATGGLAGYPAVDVFGKPGTSVLSPADGTISRFSGGPDSYTGPGGPFGYSMYLDSAIGQYFLTHFGSRSVSVGDHVKYGQQLGLIGDYPGSVPDHIHEGLRRLAEGGVHGGSGLLGSYEDGTSYVPQTGPYLLHKGEAVVDRETNSESRSNGRGDGPVVHIENAHFSSEKDVTVFARELGFQLS